MKRVVELRIKFGGLWNRVLLFLAWGVSDSLHTPLGSLWLLCFDLIFPLEDSVLYRLNCVLCLLQLGQELLNFF